jgi:tetratricopeptide (TPR) repeat protein
MRPRPLLVRLLLLTGGLGLAGAGVAWWSYTHRPDYQLRHGQEALRQGYWSEAERRACWLETAGYPDHARLLRGEAFLRQDEPNRAVEQYNQIGDRGDLLVEASAIYGQWFLLHLHRPVEAERFLLFVLARQPDHLDAHRSLASLYYDQGAWVPAVLHALRWGELDRRDGRPHRFVGLIYKDLEQHGQAIPAYQEALRRELKPAVAETVREELAECLVAQAHFAEALPILEHLPPRRRVEAPKLVALQGECLWGLGRTAEAEALLDQALADAPRCPEVLRLRAKVYLAVPESAAAVPLLERAVALDRHDFASRFQLAQAYESLGRRDAAAEQRRLAQQTQDALTEVTNLVRAASEQPWDGSVRRRLAEACRSLDQPELAERWRRSAAACP